MNRRSFMQAILAAGVAPAVISYANAMKLVARPSGVLTLSIPAMGLFDSPLQPYVADECFMPISTVELMDAIRHGKVIITKDGAWYPPAGRMPNG